MKKAIGRKILLTGAILLSCPGVSLFSAEVSKERDIAVFGVTSSDFDVPDDVVWYAEASINNVFVGLKRFNVLGFGEYRIEAQDIDDFIARVREIRSEKAKEAGTYDEKFGALVIKGEDFDRIANSFLVVVPTLSNYSLGIGREEVVVGTTTYFKRKYEVDVVLDLTFINVREGLQEEALRVSGSGSDESIDKAEKQAVDGAVSSLGMRIRQLETFRIKSGVILVKGDVVTFELGKNIGVKQGDEFEVLTRQEIGDTGRIVQLPTGLIRVKRTYPETSEAQIIYQKEPITEGDQLAEVARAGWQLSFNAGIMKVDIPGMDYEIFVVDDSPAAGEYFYINLDQKYREFLPTVGLAVEKSLGYRFKGIFEGTAALNFPLFGGIGELGIGTIFQKRRLDLRLAVLGGVLYMTTFQKEMMQSGASSITIEGTRIDFAQDPVMSIWGISAGVKGSAKLNWLIKPNFALSAGLGYRLYSPIRNWTIKIAETAGGDKNSVSIRSDSPNIVEIAGSEGMKQVKISGFEVALAMMLRF